MVTTAGPIPLQAFFLAKRVSNNRLCEEGANSRGQSEEERRYVASIFKEFEKRDGIYVPSILIPTYGWYTTGIVPPVVDKNPVCFCVG